MRHNKFKAWLAEHQTHQDYHACARERAAHFQHALKMNRNKTSSPVYHVWRFFFLSFWLFSSQISLPPFIVHLFSVFRHMYFPHPLFFHPIRLSLVTGKERLIDGLEGRWNVILWSHCWVVSQCECGVCVCAHATVIICYYWKIVRVRCGEILLNLWFALLSHSAVIMELCGVDSIFYHWWCIDEGLVAILWCPYILF